MSSEGEFLVTFPNIDSSEANQLVSSLRQAVLDSHEHVRAERESEDEDNQDLGTALAVILGTPAAFAVAKGIRDWLGRHRAAKITIVTKKGSVIAENLTSEDTVDLAAKIKASI